VRLAIAIKIGFLESETGPLLAWMIACAPGFVTAVPMSGRPPVRIKGRPDDQPLVFKAVVKAMVNYVAWDLAEHEGQTREKILNHLQARATKAKKS
jgi:hypothetical protein